MAVSAAQCVLGAAYSTNLMLCMACSDSSQEAYRAAMQTVFLVHWVHVFELVCLDHQLVRGLSGVEFLPAVFDLADGVFEHR